MKDLQVFSFGEKSVLGKCVILGLRARMDTCNWGLTPVPETPPGCQIDLFLGKESLKTSTTSDCALNRNVFPFRMHVCKHVFIIM